MKYSMLAFSALALVSSTPALSQGVNCMAMPLNGRGGVAGWDCEPNSGSFSTTLDPNIIFRGMEQYNRDRESELRQELMREQLRKLRGY